jgi:dTDP-4-amino-4,6-dideoxygalactose transaminase
VIPLVDPRPQHAELSYELNAVWRQIVTSGISVGGPLVQRFETEFAEFCGTRHAVGVANGTDALALTLRCLGIGRGDGVVVPANTFWATAEAVVMAGANPQFADVDRDSLLLTAAQLEAAITPVTAAVIVVHLYGHMTDMEALCATARRHGIAVIEDAAQAHGASWHSRRAGSIGEAGCFSFYPGKNLGALGDGGAVVTSDGELASRIRCIANHGRTDGLKDVHTESGVNSRLDALQAGVLTAKLRRLNAWNTRRRKLAGIYANRLREAGVSLVEPCEGSESAWHLCVARVADRDRIARDMRRSGIEVGIHYRVPCHEQPAFRKIPHMTLPHAEQAAATVLSLPMYPHLSCRDVDRVCSALETAMASASVQVQVTT